MSRRHSPWLAVVGVATVIAALFAVMVTMVWAVALENTDAGENDQRVALALFGLIPALGTLAATITRRGWPWAWFGATLLWYLLVFVVYSP